MSSRRCDGLLGLRICKRCGKEKPETEYHLCNAGKNRRRICKLCQHAEQRALMTPAKRAAHRSAAARWRERNNNTATRERYAAHSLRCYYSKHAVRLADGKKQRDELCELYIRKLLVAGTKVSTKAIPIALIRAKKLNIQIKRHLDEKCS